MIDNKYPESELTGKIIGCAMEVHRILGNGFQEVIYQLEDVHLAQAINYLEAYGMGIGLLINFGNTSLQFKRVMKPNKNYSQSKNQ